MARRHEATSLSQNHSTYPVLQDLHIEVHEKTYARTRQAKVSDDLCNVNRMDPLNRLDLEDEPIRNKEIYAMVAQYLVAISD